jgi:hypothetical protein
VKTAAPTRSAERSPALAAALLGLLTAGCFGPRAVAPSEPRATHGPTVVVRPSASGDPRSTTAVVDAGDLRLSFQAAAAPELDRIRMILSQSAGLADMVAQFNDTFALPVDIPVVFEVCDEENAYFDEQTGIVQLCYELVDRYQWIFTDEQSTAAEVKEETEFAAYFTIFHELGHALIHLYHLPIVGDEEDAADNFAVLFLIAHGATGQEAALAAADQFQVDHEDSATQSRDAQDLPYWDEHALDAQRMYGVLCLVYGSDPTGNGYLVAEDNLPAERAEVCVDEYAAKAEAWATLLAEHLKRAGGLGAR